jgi:hypothetical protein
LAKAPKNAPQDDWDEAAPAVQAEPMIDVVCVSPDRPHIADGVALNAGQRASIPHSIAKKFFKSRHLIRAEDFDEDMLPKATATTADGDE